MLTFCGSLEDVRKRMGNGEILEEMGNYLASLRDGFDMDGGYLCRDTVLGYFAVDAYEAYVGLDEMKMFRPSRFASDFSSLIYQAYDAVFPDDAPAQPLLCD